MYIMILYPRALVDNKINYYGKIIIINFLSKIWEKKLFEKRI